MVDIPGARSSHTAPTPRGGGIALVGALALAALISGQIDDEVGLAIAIAGLVCGAIGIAEDLRGVPTLLRFTLQGVTAIVAVSIIWSSSPDGWVGGFGVAAIAAFWLVAFVNATNFMDGINGISGIHAAVGAVYYLVLGELIGDATIAIAAATVGAAALAFLPYNFPRARVFLGDSGSYLIGGWIGCLAVGALVATGNVLVATAPLWYYVADTGVTIVDRARRREAITQPHRSHAYQRRVQRGWSHASSAALVGLVVACCGALGLVARATTLAFDIVLACLAAALCLATVVLGRRLDPASQSVGAHA